jgi:transcriptional regulator with XRE-family HTH domain
VAATRGVNPATGMRDAAVRSDPTTDTVIGMVDGYPQTPSIDAGLVLRQARAEAGLSQAELARRAGTSQAAISNIERGLRQPTVDLVDRLLRACGRQLTAAPVSSAIEVDPYDLELLRMNVQLAPERRLANMSRIMRLKGLARR